MEVAGDGLTLAEQKKHLGIGRELGYAAKKRRERRRNYQTKLLNARAITLATKGAYKNKQDTSLASAHWENMTRECPGRERHVVIRNEKGRPIASPDWEGGMLARVDASGELKQLPCLDSNWSCGTLTQLGKTKKWCVQKTTHYKYDTVAELYADFVETEEYKEHLAGGSKPISPEKYRQAKPYYVVEAGPNECSCPLHTEVEANRDALRRRIRSVHKQASKLLLSFWFVGINHQIILVYANTQAKKDGTCKGDCLHSMFFKMTESSAAEKDMLLCAPCEVPELSVGGMVPLLYSKKCSEGYECEECGWDEEKGLRRKMPPMPPCFLAAMKDKMEWEQRMLEGSHVASTSSNYHILWSDRTGEYQQLSSSWRPCCIRTGAACA